MCLRILFNLVPFFQNGVISKLVEHKRALHSSILRICDLVQRRDFLYTMTNLGMLEVLPSDSTVSADDPAHLTRPQLSPSYTSDMSPTPPIDYKSIKLNLIKHLCESPNILYSNLSKNALRLLHSGEMSDMEFEVISCVQFTQSNRSAFLANQSLPTVHIFRAHRAIVCSRCEYFRRALLSGMKEDIDRKIVVQDTSPVIFRRFLLYLYGAPIDKTVSADQICELMLLGDRYSLEELKDICEQILKAQIDEESVICLLSIADRFNANTLKSNCLAFISNRMHLIKQELFVSLGAKLKEEVYELINWHWRSRTHQPWTTTANATNGYPAGGGDSAETKASEGGVPESGGGGVVIGSANNSLHPASSSSSSSPSSGAAGAVASSRSPNRTRTATTTSTTSPFM